MNRVIGILILACLAWSPMVAAQLSGTLFSNADERAYLDVLRRNFLAERLARGFDIQESDIVIPEIEDGTATEAAPAGPVYYTLGGIMSRRDGSRRIWLNNRALEENQLPANASVMSSNGALVLQFPTPNGNRILRPGQTLELNAGSVVENYKRTVTAPAPPITALPGEDETPAADTAEQTDSATATASDTSQASGQGSDEETDLDAALSNLPPELMNNPAAIEGIINILSSRADRLEDEREQEEEEDEEAL
jgi:hypothetical protein